MNLSETRAVERSPIGLTRRTHMVAAVAMLVSLPVSASTEINSATLAQLEALSGVGTALAARMIEERAKRPFTDWADLQGRLKGLGPKLAAKLTEQGLVVNGARYAPAFPIPAKRGD